MGMTLIAEVNGDGASATIDITSIPQTYKAIKLTGKLDPYQSSGTKTITLGINSTLYTDYSDNTFGGLSFGAMGVSYVPVATSTTTAGGYGESAFEIDIPSYTGNASDVNTYHRDFFNSYTHIRHGNFDTTDAVTSIQFNTNADYFTTDDVVRIWGID